MGARENSVKHLGNFYTVIVGLALTTAIYNLVDANGQVRPFNGVTLLLCVAFVATLLPFYHGAMRHLDKTYLEVDEHAAPKPGALMADFIILFLEGCIFIVLGTKVAHPVAFTFLFTSLLLLDSVWAFFAHLLSPAPRKQELTWAGINFVTVLVLGGFIYSRGLIDSLSAPVPPSTIGIVLCVIALARTVIDYWFSWKHGYYSW